jgi:hypothetical protein
METTNREAMEHYHEIWYLGSPVVSGEGKT